MAFGILEPKDRNAHVPGTSLLDVHTQTVADNSRILKKGTGRNSHVVLVPQPSDDPNDPLNWPLWMRDCLLVIMMWCVIVTVPLITDLKINFTQFSYLAGYCLLITGAIGPFMAAGTRKYGKRPGLLFSMICAFAGSIWAAAATSYSSMLGARMVQGLSMAYFESVVYAFIGDLYFVHERGTRTAIFVIMYQSLSNIPALVAGKLSQNLGWRWVFWLLTIFVGIGMLLAIFFGWEVSYNRHSIETSEITTEEDLQRAEEFKAGAASVEMEENSGPAQPPRRSFVAKLSPVSGVYSKDSLLKLVVTPFLTLLNPAVIWALITLAFPVLWLVGLSLVIAQIFAAPPYFLTPTELGYMWAGPIVVGLITSAVAGPLSDWSAKWLSRRNAGRYEPEFRLYLVFGIAVFCGLGYYLFGYLISKGVGVVSISIVFGLTLGGAQFSAVCVGSYVNDAYQAISVEVFIIIMVIKNFLFYGFSQFINEWVTVQGPRNFFYTVGGIQLGLCLFTIPLYIFGKRLRLWWHQLAFAQKLVARV
ncbi:hypothetical protein LTS17_000935 [Exophiala oligosperma]